MRRSNIGIATILFTYTLMQSVRAGICRNYRDYPNTRIEMALEDVLNFAKDHRAYMEGVEYKRYKRNRRPTR